MEQRGSPIAVRWSPNRRGAALYEAGAGQRPARFGAALKAPPKSVSLERPQHRARRVAMSRKLLPGEPHHQVEHHIERTRECIPGWMAEDQGPPRLGRPYGPGAHSQSQKTNLRLRRQPTIPSGDGWSRLMHAQEHGA
jgi:hypothetical protein